MQITNPKPRIEPRIDYIEPSKKQKVCQVPWIKPCRKYILSEPREGTCRDKAPEHMNDESMILIASAEYKTIIDESIIEPLATSEHIPWFCSKTLVDWKHTLTADTQARDILNHNSAHVWLVDIPTSLSKEQEFNKLKAEWQGATGHLSSIEDKSLHHAYQRIIGMGKDAIPLILRELEKKPGHWFWALSAITGENPIKNEDSGIMKNMAASWIEWGRKRGYL